MTVNVTPCFSLYPTPTTDSDVLHPCLINADLYGALFNITTDRSLVVAEQTHQVYACGSHRKWKMLYFHLHIQNITLCFVTSFS